MKEMKYMKNLRKMMVFTCLALLGALQVTAATFKPYKPQQQTKMVRSMYPMATTTPNAAFRSTSVMTGSGSEDISTSTLNENGTVNESAYGVGRSNVSGPRRVGTPDDENIPHSGSEQTNPNGFPLGDAVLPLLLLAGAYLFWRARRRRGLVD